MKLMKISRNRIVFLLMSALILLLVLLFLQQRPVNRNHSEKTGMAVKDFSLLDQHGKVHHLYDYSFLDGIVIFSHGSYCNVSSLNIPELQELGNEYGYVLPTSYESETNYDSSTAHNEHEARLKTNNRDSAIVSHLVKWWDGALSLFSTATPNDDKKILFLLLNANIQEDESLLAESLKQLGVEFPILKDHTQLVSKDLNFDRTGEAILIDPKTWTVQFRGPVNDRIFFETQKKEAENHYLKSAIEALISGESQIDSSPQAAGCLIYYDDAVTDEVSDDLYAAQIAPILEKNCKVCHQPGGIGPWSMDSYEMVKAWSPMMREVIMNRRMPPWHADPHYGNFKNDISLSNDEMKNIVGWIDSGLPRGTGEDPLTGDKDEKVNEWALGEPDLILSLPEQKIPAKGPLDYLYPELKLPLTEDKWVRAVEMKPSNKAVMHHAFSFITYPKSMRKEQPKWLFGLRSYFGVYVPGGDVYSFPDNTGIFLPKGSGLKFQLHYDPKGYETTDTMRVALYFHDEVPQNELEVVSVLHHDFTIPAYAPDHEVESVYTFENDVLLHGLFPHMHYRGSRFKFDIIDENSNRETLLSVPDYKFNWQRTYLLDEPVFIAAGTRISATGAFDNSVSSRSNPDASQTVKWGEQSWEEMFLGYLIYSKVEKSQE